MVTGPSGPTAAGTHTVQPGQRTSSWQLDFGGTVQGCQQEKVQQPLLHQKGQVGKTNPA